MTKAAIALKSMIESKEDDAASVRDGQTNLKRSGTWFEQEMVDMAAANPERTKAFYDMEKRETDIFRKELLAARPFTTHAKQIAVDMFVKESSKVGNSGRRVTNVDDLTELSQKLVTGMPSEVNAGRATIYQVKSDIRTADEIVEADEMVAILFKEIDKKWPNRPQNKMILTWNLIRGKLDHLLMDPEKMPSYKPTMDLIARMEEDEVNWEDAARFMDYSGISRKMYETVIIYITERAQELGLDLIKKSGYYDRQRGAK